MEGSEVLSSLNENRFVAFLDILGFKDLVEKNDHDVLSDIFGRIADLTEELKTIFYGTGEEMKVQMSREFIVESFSEFLAGKFLEENEMDPKDSENVKSVQSAIVEKLKSNEELISRMMQKRDSTLNLYQSIEMLTISDSIFIWSKDDSLPSFNAITMYVRTMLMLFMCSGVPLRGAITYGPMSVKEKEYLNAEGNGVKQKNIYGKAIVDAYLLEGKQQWSGCIVDKKCFEHLGKDASEFDLNRIVLYEVPLKSGKIEKYPVINWATIDTVVPFGDNGENIEGIFASHNKEINNWAVKTKIDNTIKFFITMKEVFVR